MLTIGAHLSMARGFAHMAQTAVEMDANTFQFFSRNPRGSTIKQMDCKDLSKFQEIRNNHNFQFLLAHGPYTLNLASAKESVAEFSKTVLKEDVERMDSIGIEYLNIHPGSHNGQGSSIGIEKIIEGLDHALTGDGSIMVLLETMSGKGSEIGWQFSQLKNILDGVKYPARLGVCMDLCHVFSAGYDIVNDLEGVLNEFDKTIGLNRLKAIHLNDSMMDFGSKKDRHAVIGGGRIGLDAIIQFMQNSAVKHLPYYLETPLDDGGHKEEIAMLRKLLEA